MLRTKWEVGSTYQPLWDSILGGHDPYKITQQLTLSKTYTTMLEHEGTVYEFRYIGEPFSPFSSLQVTMDNGACRTYKGGWELETVSKAIEECVIGWHLEGPYARHRITGEEEERDELDRHVVYV